MLAQTIHYLWDLNLKGSYVYADGRMQSILDTQQQKLNSADIGWDPATNMLYVPTFLGNSVAAYRLLN